METPFSEIKLLKNGKSRILGIDLGQKKIGLAISDGLWMIASPHMVMPRQKLSVMAKDWHDLVKERDICALVYGYPLHMSGDKGSKTQSVTDFAKALDEYLQLPYNFFDERLSTFAVTRTLKSANMSHKKRAKVVDKMAAGFILQTTLDYLNMSG